MTQRKTALIATVSVVALVLCVFAALRLTNAPQAPHGVAYPTTASQAQADKNMADLHAQNNASTMQP